RALVADHRCTGRARGEDLVGERPVDAVALGEDQALRDGAVEPEDERVDCELHDGARPQWPDVKDAAREAIEDRAGTFEVIRFATDHDGQLASERRRDTPRD